MNSICKYTGFEYEIDQQGQISRDEGQEEEISSTQQIERNSFLDEVSCSAFCFRTDNEHQLAHWRSKGTDHICKDVHHREVKRINAVRFLFPHHLLYFQLQRRPPWFHFPDWHPLQDERR